MAELFRKWALLPPYIWPSRHQLLNTLQGAVALPREDWEGQHILLRAKPGMGRGTGFRVKGDLANPHRTRLLRGAPRRPRAQASEAMPWLGAEVHGQVVLQG